MNKVKFVNVTCEGNIIKGRSTHYRDRERGGGGRPRGPPMAPKAQVHAAAVKLAIPVSERDERVSYLDQVILNQPSIESPKKEYRYFYFVSCPVLLPPASALPAAVVARPDLRVRLARGDALQPRRDRRPKRPSLHRQANLQPRSQVRGLALPLLHAGARGLLPHRL